ncbi:Hypothetical predicted protein, partial [Pelobates cultripes]
EGMLLAMRCQLEDVDNRGQKCNIRVRGVPKVDGEENVGETLSGLFRAPLPTTVPAQFKFERAHRGARSNLGENLPRDLICCMHSFLIKEAIMRRARDRPTSEYRGAQVSLYNDLSPLMLEARLAIKP